MLVLQCRVLQATCPLFVANISHNHGRTSVGGQGDVPLLFEVEGTPCILSPYFFAGRHFCANAHCVHLMIGTIFVTFSRLILIKLLKFLPPDVKF